MDKIFPVILAGGEGKRLWPLSRKDRPKPFIDIGGAGTLLQKTLSRVAESFSSCHAVTIVCHKKDMAHIKGAIGDSFTSAGYTIFEHEGQGTAFAIAVAALRVQEREPEGLLLVLPSDHHFDQPHMLDDAIKATALQARGGKIVMFGVRPISADTAYGYISYACADNNGAKGLPVTGFVEKPAKKMAKDLIRAGLCLWNTGIFLVKADVVLAEIRTRIPDIYNKACLAWEQAEKGSNCAALAPSWEAEEKGRVSFDRAVLEKTQKAVVVRIGDGGWQDLGTWQSIRAHLPRDSDGNAVHGNVAVAQASNCLIYNETGLKVTADGIEDMVIVVSGDEILVRRSDSRSPEKIS